jgi:FMN phosphatase YigB (HAD superfamily)
MGALAAVLIDVGGVLWDFHDEEHAHAQRLERLQALGLSGRDAQALRDELTRRTTGIETTDAFDLIPAIRDAIAATGLRCDPVAVRQAMCVPAADWVGQRPDAIAFLEGLGRLGLRRVIVSNVVWRAAEDYWRDFTELGLAPHLDSVVSSYDLLVRKPNLLMFQIALAHSGAILPSTCVMLGDREDKDIVPARALGLYAILMASGPVEHTRADAVVTSLAEAGEVIARWNEEPPVRSASTTEVNGLAIHLANDSPDERQVRDTLVRMLQTYDTSRYHLTDRVVIDRDSPDAHSHPVLTLRTRFSVRTPLGALSTFLHEQIHWHLDGANEAATRAAMEVLRARYPDVSAAETRSPESAYLHLLVNHLEHRALAALVGEDDALATTRAQVIYRWIYERVLADADAIAAIVAEHGLGLE